MHRADLQEASIINSFLGHHFHKYRTKIYAVSWLIEQSGRYIMLMLSLFRISEIISGVWCAGWLKGDVLIITSFQENMCLTLLS